MRTLLVVVLMIAAFVLAGCFPDFPADADDVELTPGVLGPAEAGVPQDEDAGTALAPGGPVPEAEPTLIAMPCQHLFADRDCDGFGVSDDVRCLAAPEYPYLAAFDGDCYDHNPRARPGQTQWFKRDRGDGSFDYDCDGVATMGLAEVGSCSGGLTCAATIGWIPVAPVPGCGEQGSVITECGGGIVGRAGGFGLRCVASTIAHTQRCR